jgi:hypothetical protein
VRGPTPARVAPLVTLADLNRLRGETDAAATLLAEAGELDARVGSPPWDDVCVIKTAGEIAIRTGRPGDAVGIAERVLGGVVPAPMTRFAQSGNCRMD